MMNSQMQLRFVSGLLNAYIVTIILTIFFAVDSIMWHLTPDQYFDLFVLLVLSPILPLLCITRCSDTWFRHFCAFYFDIKPSSLTTGKTPTEIPSLQRTEIIRLTALVDREIARTEANTRDLIVAKLRGLAKFHAISQVQIQTVKELRRAHQAEENTESTTTSTAILMRKLRKLELCLTIHSVFVGKS